MKTEIINGWFLLILILVVAFIAASIDHQHKRKLNELEQRVSALERR